MKIYTRTGDDGPTGLFGGGRLSKCDPRLECYGTVDELNSFLGWAAATSPDPVLTFIRQIQNELFVIGSHLATPDRAMAGTLPKLADDDISRLEKQIDDAEKELSPLTQFILPGGCETAARLHIARTVCRRAERLLVSFALQHPMDGIIITYMNRLSDWLFVMARFVNFKSQTADIPWEK